MRECEKHFKKNWIGVYMDLTQGLMAPREFHFWTAMSVLATTMGRNCWYDMAAFKYFPNMYIILVAKSGMTKSTTGNFGTDLYLEAFPDELFVSGKMTVNKFLDNLAVVHKTYGESRAYIYATEYRDMLETLGGSDLISVITTLFDCPKRYPIQTKEGGNRLVNDVCLNMLACSTPEWLVVKSGNNDTIEGGYTARILYIFKDRPERRITKPWLPVGHELMRECLIKDLQSINKLSGEFKETPEAWTLHDTWFQDETNFAPIDSRLDGFQARKQSYMMKTAMCMSAAAGDTMILSEKLIAQSIKLIESVESVMPNVYVGLGGHKHGEMMDRLTKKLADSKDYKCLRSVLVDIGSRIKGMTGRDIQDVLRTLEDAGRVRSWEQTRGNRTAVWYQLTKIEIMRRKLAPLRQVSSISIV